MTLKSLLPLGLALAAAAAACGPAAPAPQPAAPPAAAMAAPAGAQPGEADAGEPAGLIIGNLRLSSDGLGAGMPGLHTNQSFRFGMPKAEIVAAVAQMRSWETPSEANGQCGAGPMEFTRFGKLTLNIQNGRFVGWSLDGPRGAEPIEEEYGLAIGTPRAEVFAIDSEEVRFETTARGVEFDAGGIHGLLSSNAPDATVTRLWAGISCQVR
ncbi:MAG: hypothetical protein QOD42_167 [Sphingomonadales bacterium]|jgi:hypothetical protein|nr:hypothetical protein [Sphingomonadales bacterium]